MKRLLLLLPLLLLALPANGQTYKGYSYCAGTASTSSTCTAFSSSNTSNNVIVGIIICKVNPCTGVTVAGNSNTYSLVATCATAPYTFVIFEADAINAGANTLSISGASTGAYPEGYFAEYAGLSTSGFDKNACAHSSVTSSISSGNTSTTATANELIFGVYLTTGSVHSAGSGFTGRSQNTGGSYDQLEDMNVTSTGAYAATGTTSTTTWQAAVATFQASGGGGGVTRRRAAVINSP